MGYVNDEFVERRKSAEEVDPPPLRDVEESVERPDAPLQDRVRPGEDAEDEEEP